MPLPARALPDQVLDALQRGKLLEAIRLLRNARGLGLRDAKKALDDYLRGRQSGLAGPDSGAPRSAGFPGADRAAAAPEAAAPQTDLDAVRRLREQTGMGVEEAREALYAVRGQSTFLSGRSPGEEPRRSSAIWWIVAALAAVAVHFLLRDAMWV